MMLSSLLWCFVALAQPGAPTEARYARPELLIEPKALKDSDGKYRILDVRLRAQYSKGHIPGAVNVSPFGWAKAFEAEQDEDEWSTLLGEAGIALDTPVVVYDDAGSKDAARIWYILRFWGVRDVRLLNGGWGAWTAAGLPTEKESPEVKETTPELRPRYARLAAMDDLKLWTADKSVQILDTRSLAEYRGEAGTAQRKGHIPGCVRLEWSELIDGTSKRFKSAAEIEALFKQAKIDLRRPAVTYCQSGGRASVMAFALELMGARDVRVYYRSWAEWGNAKDTPVETPKPAAKDEPKKPANQR